MSRRHRARKSESCRQIKTAEGWKLVCPTINTNGREGYFPMMDVLRCLTE